MRFSASSHHGNCFPPLAYILFNPQRDDNSEMGPHGSFCLFDYSGMSLGSSSLCGRVRLGRPDNRTAVGSPFPFFPLPVHVLTSPMPPVPFPPVYS